MPTTLDLLLAVALTLFLAFQGRALAHVLRSWRARRSGAGSAPTDLLWTTLPMLVVLLLAARSWLAVLDVASPAVASAVHGPPPAAAPLTAPPE
ncbi:MAG: hypothetical protein L0027_12200 [Candidatus Rokubacteria bacterium]|nr:hypothetical protein [Candidatus Rokubacteria bacterium]